MQTHSRFAVLIGETADGRRACWAAFECGTGGGRRPIAARAADESTSATVAVNDGLAAARGRDPSVSCPLACSRDSQSRTCFEEDPQCPSSSATVSDSRRDLGSSVTDAGFWLLKTAVGSEPRAAPSRPFPDPGIGALVRQNPDAGGKLATRAQDGSLRGPSFQRYEDATIQHGRGVCCGLTRFDGATGPRLMATSALSTGLTTTIRSAPAGSYCQREFYIFAPLPR
jgi:hypothetical protein